MTTASAEYTEKRDFRRLNINSPVTIIHGDNEYAGVCKDLSGAGMLIETADNFSVGNTMTVAIKQDDNKGIPFNASVEVIRINTDDHNKSTIGLAIKEILD